MLLSIKQRILGSAATFATKKLPHDHYHDTQLTCGLFRIECVGVTRSLGGCDTDKPKKEEYPQVRQVSARTIKLEADSRVSGTNNDGARKLILIRKNIDLIPQLRV